MEQGKLDQSQMKSRGCIQPAGDRIGANVQKIGIEHCHPPPAPTAIKLNSYLLLAPPPLMGGGGGHCH